MSIIQPSRLGHPFCPLEQLVQRQMRASSRSWRVDETYICAAGRWTYLYRAIDSAGNMIEFLLSPNRDLIAAKGFSSPRLERIVLRALASRQLDLGKSAAEVSKIIPLTSKVVREVARRYTGSGLEPAVYDKPRPGAAALLEPAARKRIIAMVCSDSPPGRARWTVRLVAEEAVKRRLAPKVGRETIRLLLLHDDLEPWREKNVERAGTDRAIRRTHGGRTGDVRTSARSR